MKKTDDQIDFNFSRPLDIQRNLDVDFLDIVLSDQQDLIKAIYR